jgi:hypothetical protein
MNVTTNDLLKEISTLKDAAINDNNLAFMIIYVTKKIVLV